MAEIVDPFETPAASTIIDPFETAHKDAAVPPTQPKSFSDRLSNMWDKATPGGPLWMIKQTLGGMQSSVEAAKAATSTPQTEEEQFQQTQGREALPGATMQAAQFLTPAAPKGTGGLFAAPIRAAREVVPAATDTNRQLANEFGINLSRGQSTQDLDRIRYEDMAARGAYGKEAQDRAAAFFQKQYEDSQAASRDIGEQTARTAPVVENPAEAGSVVAGEVSEQGLRARELQTEAERRAAAEAESQRGMVQDQGRVLNESIRQGALPIENPREAGEVVGQNVRDAAAANRQEFKGLYREFGQLPGEFNPKAVRGLGTRIGEDLSTRDEPVLIDEQLTPSASKALKALDEISKSYTPQPSASLQGDFAPFSPAPKPAAQASPKSLLQFIASKGGLSPDPELEAIGLAVGHRAQIPGEKGFFSVIRRNGDDLDRMRESAEEAGYLRGENGATSTPRDFLDAIDEELRGHKRYPEGYEGHQTARENVARSAREQAKYDQSTKGFENDLAEAGHEGLTPDVRARSVHLMSEEGMTPDEAVDHAIRQLEQEDAAVPAIAKAPEVGGIDLRGIDQVRKKLVAYYQSARMNPTDARAMRGILDGFDNQIEKAISDGLFSGDPRALQALQDARASYSRYRQLFTPRGSGDDVGVAMRRIVERNATPEEISNMIIGSGKLGNAGLPVRIADRLEKILGADSDSWSTIRQAMWQKASQVRNSAGEVDPVRSANSISEFVGSTLAQRMFTPQERQAMRSHAQGVRDLDRNIETLPATQTAERVRQAYQDVFGGAEIGGAAGATFRRIVDGTATPEEVVNGVFKVIGSQNPGNTARAIGAIERIVGSESQTMAAVRQGVWQKLTQAAAGKDQPGAQKAMQAINEFLNGTGRSVAEQLYSDNERALMKRYADALKLTIISKYARTNSDTAPALLAAVRKYGAAVMGALGYVHGDGGLAGLGVGKMLEWSANRIEGAAQNKRLSDSLDDIIPKPKPFIGGSSTPSAIVRKAIPASTNRGMPDARLLHAAQNPEDRKSNVAGTRKPPTNAGFARGGNVSDHSGRKVQFANGGAVHNHNPSEAQKQAGNYAKTHRFFHGMDITLENLKGHPRSGVGKDGKKWSVSMPCDYGYIKRTIGVDQKDTDSGRFDEHKCMLGFPSEKEALKTYRAGFSDGKDRVKHVRRLTIGEFKDWLERGDTTKPIKVALRLAYEEKRQG